MEENDAPSKKHWQLPQVPMAFKISVLLSGSHLIPPSPEEDCSNQQQDLGELKDLVIEAYTPIQPHTRAVS